MVANRSFATSELFILSTLGIRSAEALFGKPLMADGTEIRVFLCSIP
jgi:hypothetical protein